MSSKQRVMVQPINVIFRYLQQQTKVSLWLYDNVDFRIEGRIVGFDEFMNVVMSDAEEVWLKKQEGEQRKRLGRILLKGDNIVRGMPLRNQNMPLIRQRSLSTLQTLIQPAV